MTSVALPFSYVALCGTLCYVQFGKHNQTTNTISRRKIVICIFLQVAVVSLLLQGLLYPLFVWNTLHWIMSSDNLSEGGAKRTSSPQASCSGSGARSKGTSKENEDKDVDNKGPVLAPLYARFPPNIKYSYGDEDNVQELKPTRESVDDLYTRMVDHMHKAIKAINKQIFDSLEEKPSKDEQKKYNFYVYEYLQEQAILRINLTQGEKDWMKYETAKTLKKRLPKIRDAYKKDWESTNKEIRQRGVALYFIDTLTFRAGNKAEEGEAADEEEEGETADEEDAVGCCNLMVKHIMLLPQEGNKCFVEFNFVGKSKVEYQKKVEVEKKVYEKIQEFKDGKRGNKKLFHKLTPTKLNTYLKTQMPRLTTRVFRTCNASITLQDKLVEFTNEALKTVNETHEDRLPLLLRAYHQAVQAAAVLCNHKRSTPKDFDKQMEKLEEKVKAKKNKIKNAEKDMQGGNEEMEQLVKSLSVELKNLKLSVEDKKKSEHINDATTLKYYLDPRIRVAWSKKQNIPVEKVYKKSQKWVLDAKADFEF